MEKKTVETKDGKTIAIVEQNADSGFFAILIPMMPAVKERFEPFMNQLLQAGIGSVALDLRGHGESSNGPNGYKTFDVTEHANYIKDAEAVFAYLVAKNIRPENIIFIGASIGANVAITLLADIPEAKLAVALSPGLDYKGISTKPSIEALRAGQELLLIASEEDTYSYLSAKELHEMQKARTDFWVLDEKGHGNELPELDDELPEKIIQWMKKRL